MHELKYQKESNLPSTSLIRARNAGAERCGGSS